ncbi:DUF4397 domain-containing protein [Natranaerovirga pectinivora]|uniref:DUF4397 domain-containing protein n=1 Tax=Natranaerovirga pectinivora TaxID=682400 RepID=UPI0014047670|nr:DUF4397 domain-containing protein [Natranaerovirga pectinivora]
MSTNMSTPFGHTPINEDSYIRFANFIPELLDVDIYFNDTLKVRNLRYGEETSYISFSPGDYKITIFSTIDNAQPLVETSIEITTPGLILTIPLHSLDKEELNIIEDNALIIPNEIFVKFVNLSPNSPPLNFIFNLVDIFRNIIYDYSSNYKLIEKAPNYHIIIQNAQTNKILYDLPNIVLEPGNAYTFFAIGIMDGDPPFKLVVSLDGSSYLTD